MIHICNSPWGIGMYELYTDDGEIDVQYGLGYPTDNPFAFHPDWECCTEIEIRRWELAKSEFLRKMRMEGKI